MNSRELPAPPSFCIRHSAFCISLLTVLAGVLRFTALDRPCLWGDEAWVYSRACGTYRQMLAILQNDGFAPFHYELYWVLNRCFRMTPFVMRFVPALAGTLMVPAVYFLARQVVARQTALLAAAFACCSAYLLHYSRDAKMYSHFWLFCTLFMACLLWWLRTGRLVPWLAWVASSLAMIGTQFLGAALIPVALIVLVTHARTSWKYLLGFLGGLAILAAGVVPLFKNVGVEWDAVPLVNRLAIGGKTYSHKFYQWHERTQEQVLGWAKWYNVGRGGPDLVLYATTAYLFCWEWHQDVHLLDKPFPGTVEANIPPEYLTCAKASTILLIGLPLLGLFPWHTSYRWWKARHDKPLAASHFPSRHSAGSGHPAAQSDERSRAESAFPRPEIPPSLSLDRDDAAEVRTGLPPSSVIPPSAPERWGRPALWVLTWLTLPAYLFFCRSASHPSAPRTGSTPLARSPDTPTSSRPRA